MIPRVKGSAAPVSESSNPYVSGFDMASGKDRSSYALHFDSAEAAQRAAKLAQLGEKALEQMRAKGAPACPDGAARLGALVRDEAIRLGLLGSKEEKPK